MKSETNASKNCAVLKESSPLFYELDTKKYGQAHKGKSVLRRRGESVNLSDRTEDRKIPLIGREFLFNLA